MGKNPQVAMSIVPSAVSMKSHYLAEGIMYVGQTGSSGNERAREHELSIGKSQGAHLPTYFHACGCEPRFNEIKILNRSKNRDARELPEAFYTRESQ